MEDDIDLEEHDLLKHPALRSVFPDLGILKREIIDFEMGEETQTETEFPKGIVHENQQDSTLEVNSGNPPLVCSKQDLDVKPEVLYADIDDTRTINNNDNNLSESDKVDSHIKKESENVVPNELPFYRNRIILGKINVDAADDERNNDAPSESNNVVNNEDKTYNEPDITVAVNTEDRSSRIKKQYYEMKNRLLVKIVLTDCYTSLLGNKCYCAQCTVLFPTTEAYSEHYMSTHIETTNSTKASAALVNRKIIIHNSNKKFECDFCKKRFSRKIYLYQHIIIHTGKKRFECETCQKIFRLRKYLLKHKTLVHTGEKPMECEICNKRFSNMDYLVRHKFIHSDKMPFECMICKKRFRYLHHLNSHKFIHTDEKKFECETCKKTFRQPTCLDRHIKTVHTGHKRFECETCKRKFCNNSHLKRHKLIHTNAKPFECDHCNQKFSRKSHVTRHMRVHTGKKPYK